MLALRPVVLFAFVVLAAALARLAPAQCQPNWLPGAPASGPADNVFALARLPNGDLVAGGEFLVADGVRANHVARWDGTTWHALGGGTDGPVYALTVLPTGDLVAAGSFTTAGGAPAANIAQWNGTAWSALGAGLDASAYALLALPSGDLIAGGVFTVAGTTPASSIARWSAGSWSPLGTGVPFFDVLALAQLPNGNIVAGGSGNPALGSVAQWNGATWLGVGPLAIYTVFSLLAMPDGSLFVGGLTNGLPLAPGLVRWSGSGVVAYSTSSTYALARSPVSGDVFAAQDGHVQRFGGTSSVFGTPRPGVRSMVVLPSGDLVVGALVLDAIEPQAVQRWTGASWQTLGGPLPPRVFAMTRFGNGDMVVGGRFGSFDGVAAANVARWNGQSWAPLGSGVAGEVSGLAVASNGDLIAGGEFQLAGGVPANRIARWNGGAWSSIGGGMPDTVHAIATRSNGDILVATRPGAIHRWDGASWAQLVPPTGGAVDSKLVTLPNDDVAIAGSIFAIWNGTSFVPLPPLPGGVGALLCRRNGDLLAGSYFPDTSPVLLWIGSAWVPYGPPLLAQVLALTELPNGDVVAGGTIQFGVPLGIVRTDGTQWSVVDGGLQPGVSVVGASERGDLMASGRFVLAGSAVAAGFARTTVPCPATAVATGTGCASVAGPVTLAALNLPWAGTTFVGRATGMAPLSVALHVLGTNPTTLPLPFAAPGCSLWVDPVVTPVLFPSGGTVLAPLTIPSSASLAGALVRSQVVGLEFDANGNLVRTTGTNALLLTVGVL